VKNAIGQASPSLVAGLVAGDDRSLAALYDAYGHVAYGLALAITGVQTSAEAVVAESFAAAWRTASSFDATQMSVLAWLTAIVRSKALGMRKYGDLVLAKSKNNGGRSGLRSLAAATAMATALSTLTASQREAIELSYYRGFTVSEIATHMGEPESGARDLLRSAMQELRAPISRTTW
jgi:RNA polymerase sigma-70 factor (ECF subfamily)